MKKITFFLILLLSQMSTSQSNSTYYATGSGLSTEEFEKFKTDLAAMMKSESYISMRKSMTEFAQKLNGVIDAVLEPDKEWDEWIGNNISKTKFKSVEEANLMRETGIRLTEQNQNEFSELYDRFMKASKEQRLEITKIEYRTN